MLALKRRYIHAKSFVFYSAFWLVVSVLTLSLFVPALNAQTTIESATIAETIRIADSEVAYGDVILYDNETDLYRVSQGVNDPRFYGVAVENPTLLVETNAELVPVVRDGRALVNVSLENGGFKEGDPLVTSSIPGKATQAGPGERNIIGFALESLSVEEGAEVTRENGESVVLGTLVAEIGGERVQEFIEEGNEDEANSDQSEEVLTGATIARYSFSALIVLASLFVTFYTFMSSIRSGVISIGRNPRAKPAIRSMVVLNVLLSLLVTTAGIFFAISILVASQ